MYIISEYNLILVLTFCNLPFHKKGRIVIKFYFVMLKFSLTSFCSFQFRKLYLGKIVFYMYVIDI